MTQEEKQKICDLYSINKLQISEIAELTNRDKSTIRNLLKKNNLFIGTTNYMSDEELNSIIFDYKNGMTPKELSIKYNRGSGYLINKLKAVGVYTYTTLHLTDKQWEEVIQLYIQGKNDEIFTKYPSLTISSLYSKMSKLKVKSGLRNYWSKEDSEIIRDNYFKYSTNDLFKMIGKRHTKDAIIDHAFSKYGYSKSRDWTQEEEDILINNYSHMTARELQELLPNRTIEAIRDRGIKYGLKSKYRLETYWNDNDTDFLVNNWDKMSDYEIGEILNKEPSSIKERRKLLGLARIDKNKQGYTTIKNMLRGQIWNWKQKSMKACKYKCVISGSKEFDIHHMVGFSDIFNEYLNSHPLKSMNTCDYSKEELDSICSSFIEFHDKYPLGVCVRSDLHTLFHTQYGKHNNSIEQWVQFVKDYKNQ